MQITATPQKAFDCVIIDTIGPMTKSVYGNQYAVTLMCDLTKHLTIIPTANKDSKTVAKAIFEHFILIYGVMRNIRTDLGTEYKNEIFSEMSKLLKYTHDFSTPHHHQTVGTVERNHRVLNAYLRSYLIDSKDDWDVYAKYFQFCYNITPNSTNKFKYSPFELVFGRQANLPTEKFEQIEPVYDIENYVKELKFRLQKSNLKTKELIEKYKLKMKAQYDNNLRTFDIKIGDKIKIRDDSSHKLEPVYRGPFLVKNIDNSNIIALNEKKNKLVSVHKDRTLPYFE